MTMSKKRMWTIRNDLFSAYYPNSVATQQVNYPPFIVKDELPVMVSDQGELVCIEQNLDAKNIGVVGQKRTGKSTLSHAIIDRLYWYQRKKVFILNDHTDETRYWRLPMTQENWYRAAYQLDLLGEEPRGLPIIPLNHTCPEYNPLPEVSVSDLTYELALSIKIDDLIKNPEIILDEPLGATEKYYTPFIGELIKRAHDVNQIMSFLEEQEKSEEIPKLSVAKLMYFFKYLFNEHISTMGGSGIAELQVTRKRGEEQESHVLPTPIALLYSDLVPSIQTSNLKEKKYYGSIINYYANMIRSAQRENILGKNQEVYIFVDELHEVEHQGARETLRGLVTAGAHSRIGLNWAAQNYEHVDKMTRKNTRFIFSTRQTAESATTLSADFSLQKNQREWLLGLRSHKQEVVGMTSERFLCYDPLSNSYYHTTEAVKGKMIMPLSFHKPPIQRLPENATIQQPTQ